MSGRMMRTAGDSGDLAELVRQSVARYESLPPEEKDMHNEAQRISFVFGQVCYDIDDHPRANPLLKEDVARRVLTYSVGPSHAESRLADPRFRKMLGLDD